MQITWWGGRQREVPWPPSPCRSTARADSAPEKRFAASGKPLCQLSRRWPAAVIRRVTGRLEEIEFPQGRFAVGRGGGGGGGGGRGAGGRGRAGGPGGRGRRGGGGGRGGGGAT